MLLGFRKEGGSRGVLLEEMAPTYARNIPELAWQVNAIF